jgi:hypothetical protein
MIGATALAVAGCGGSSGSTSSTAATPTTKAATAPIETAPEPTTTDAATGATKVTKPTTGGKTSPPGTALAVGDSAVVPYQPVDAPQSAPAKYKLKVTVTAIETGSLSDFNGIKLDATEKASKPTYVKVKMENVGSGNAGSGGNPMVEIEGVDGTGETQQSVVFFGDFPRCEYKEAPKPFMPGKSFESCSVFLIPGGITKAAYTGAEPYVTNPLTWK